VEFLGIGPTELIAILVIVFLVMGPQDLAKMGGTLGRTLRNLRQSGTWRAVQDASRQLRELPETLAREAGIDDLKETQRELNAEIKEQKEALQDLDHQLTAWTRKPEPRSQKAKPAKEEQTKTDPSSEAE